MADQSLSTIRKLQAGVKAALGDYGDSKQGDSHLNPAQKFLQFWVLAINGFLRNRCPVRASALAYTTLLALIPLLAVIASVSVSLLKSKGEEPISMMIETLVSKVAPQLDLVTKDGEESASRKQVVQMIRNYIDNISSGALGVTGMAGLVFVAIMLLSTIEATFNDIWGVTHGRTWLARIIQYWATVTLGPLIPLMAVALNAGSQLKTVETYLANMPFIGHLLVSMVPFVILSLAFGLLYQLMPNTRVRWQAALVGGVVGGSLWQMNSLMNVIYASKVQGYTTIYGPLSLLPVFMIGLYFSWLILLFGAQVAYTFQNRAAYFQQRLSENVNHLGREFVSLRVMTFIAQRFSQGIHPPTTIEISQALAVPTRLVGDVLQALVESKLLVEADGAETAFTPGRPLEKITCHDILHAIRTGKGKEVDTHDDAERALVRAQFNRIQEAERGIAAGLTLAAIVQEAKSPPAWIQTASQAEPAAALRPADAAPGGGPVRVNAPS